MRNSNLGERNVIVVSATSTGEDPNTYPIVPKGKNLKRKKNFAWTSHNVAMHHSLSLYIYMYTEVFTSTQKNMEKKSRTSWREELL